MTHPFQQLVTEVEDDDSTSHGPHLALFVDDPAANILERLPEIIEQCGVLPTLADNKSMVAKDLPAGEPKAFLLTWPVPRQGLALALRVNDREGHNEIVGFYPWVSEGSEHTFVLREIELFPSRVEARLVGDIGPEGEMSLTFFDTEFARNRTFYARDMRMQVILVGIPCSFFVFDPQPVVVTNREHIRQARAVLYADDPEERDSDAPLVYETKGMAAFIPRSDYAADYYEFAGPVKSVSPYAVDMFGRSAWRVRVTVARFGEEDFDLDLCVSEKILGESPLPEVGEDVRGVLWLQGYLWWIGAM